MTEKPRPQRPSLPPSGMSTDQAPSFMSSGGIGAGTAADAPLTDLDQQEIGASLGWSIRTPWTALIEDAALDPRARQLVLSALMNAELDEMGGAAKDLLRAFGLILGWVDAPDANFHTRRDRMAAIEIALAQCSAATGDQREARNMLERALTVLRDFDGGGGQSDLALTCLMVAEKMSSGLAKRYEVGKIIESMRNRRNALAWTSLGQDPAQQVANQTADLSRSFLGGSELLGSKVIVPLLTSLGANQQAVEVLFRTGLTPDQQRLLSSAKVETPEGARVAVWLLGVLIKAQAAGHELAVVTDDDEILFRVTL